jgi:hypothetical protein
LTGEEEEMVEGYKQEKLKAFEKENDNNNINNID